jgi:cysteine desulfurase
MPESERPSSAPDGAVYLDCNATTPVAEEVLAVMEHYLRVDFGNAGSRTHDYGATAKRAVEKARSQVGAVVEAERDEVIFTSGATESNNLAILGLAEYGLRSNRRHVISSRIEHKAVLEPLKEMQRRGFEVTLVPPDEDGIVSAAAIEKVLRKDTLLVSLMQVNNETGVIQPLDEVAEVLKDHPAYLHTDAAQGFGKIIDGLRNRRIDLISLSGHKIYGPKGVGALVTRRRGFDTVPLRPLAFGGGQERGLRPGTLPVFLIAGLGQASELALRNHLAWAEACSERKRLALDVLCSWGCIPNGDQKRCLPSVLNISLPGVDAEAALVATKGILAASNGSACNSSSYLPSHVLSEMGLSPPRIRAAVRLSWYHATNMKGLERAVKALARFVEACRLR